MSPISLMTSTRRGEVMGISFYSMRHDTEEVVRILVLSSVLPQDRTYVPLAIYGLSELLVQCHDASADGPDAVVMMQAKRKALVAVDGKLSDLAESRAVKDEEMKGLERTLVQVLVEQQKKLLSLLSEVGFPWPLAGFTPLGKYICITRPFDRDSESSPVAGVSLCSARPSFYSAKLSFHSSLYI